MALLWSYVLVLDDTIARQEAISLVDKLPAVKNWYACMDHVVFLVSDNVASDLAATLRPHLGKRRFLLMDAGTDRNGWLPKQAWEFMRTPRAIRK